MSNAKFELKLAIDIAVVGVTALLISSCFPSGGIFTQNGHLIYIWTIPAAFWIIAGWLHFLLDKGVTLPQWVLSLLARLARGSYLGLLLGSIEILDAWYVNPDQVNWEPFFTATGLSGAGVLFFERWFLKLYKKENTIKRTAEIRQQDNIEKLI